MFTFLLCHFFDPLLLLLNRCTTPAPVSCPRHRFLPPAVSGHHYAMAPSQAAHRCFSFVGSWIADWLMM
jgi:hypothetical protein